jgi:CheY-like chemotaxis protein
VYLPIAASGQRRAAAAPPAADPDPSPKLDRSSAWVVDDEPLVAQVISRFLRSEYEVLVADGPRDVLRRLAAGERFDVLVCDVMMPDMSGVELGMLIERDWPELASRIVFVSGGVLSKEMSDFIHEPHRTFLDKPFDARALGATIHRIVAAQGAAKQR